MNSPIIKLINNMEKVIIGKRQVLTRVVAVMLCNGHVLIEDVPGTGKTLLVSTLARSVAGKFNRIQLTPDIMPSDVVGFSMIHPETREFQYREGAAMCNFLLADEINRASPKAQSSLLEVMEEFQISLDGLTHKLPKPFMTLATQNPVETYGTYHLPEAQMDRFLMKISMGYPSLQDELRILEKTEEDSPISELNPVLSLEEIVELQKKVKRVKISLSVKEYILKIVYATRNSAHVKLGISPRGSIALYNASKAMAFIRGREFVTPDDVREMAVSVLAHRLILTPKGKATMLTQEDFIVELLNKIIVPMDEFVLNIQ